MGEGGSRPRELWDFVRQAVHMGIFARVLDVRQAVCQQIAMHNVTTEGTEGHHIKDQGDLTLYSVENLMRRRALKLHPRVKSTIDEFWGIMDVVKDDAANISRGSYIELSHKLHKVLVPDVSWEEAQLAAEVDWAKDTGGAPSMSYELFRESLFELADLVRIRRLRRLLHPRTPTPSHRQLTRTPMPPPPCSGATASRLASTSNSCATCWTASPIPTAACRAKGCAGNPTLRLHARSWKESCARGLSW